MALGYLTVLDASGNEQRLRVEVNSDGTLSSVHQAANALLPPDAAKESTLATVAKEATLADVAKEATLGTRASETKLEAVRALLDGKAATEVTLAELKTAAQAIQSAAEDVKAAVEGTLSTQLVGSNGEQDLRGLAANRPAANNVPIGTTFFAVDTQAVSVSDGTNWRAL